MEGIAEKPLHKIRRFRKQSFEAAQHATHYTIDRDLDNYDDSLPTFRDKTLIQLIAEKLNGQQPVAILDAGCGAGIALLQIKELFPDVNIAGISGRDLKLKNRFKTQLEHFDYRIGDVQKMGTIFRDKKFDLIISHYTFIYLGDKPNAIRQCYKLLKPNGIMLISDAFDITPDEADALQNIWAEKGIETEIKSKTEDAGLGLKYFDLAIRKNPEVEKLPMPFNYKAKPYNGVIPRDYEVKF